MNRASLVETAVLAILGIVLLVLHVRYADLRRIDSDEPQHLHVAWTWSAGGVAYRDAYDVHPPLFHLIAAPLVSVIGETPSIVVRMRHSLFPVYLLLLFSIVILGRSLFDLRTGIVAALWAGFEGRFFAKTLEVRPDALWTAFVVFSVSALVARRRSIAHRGFLGGLFAGAAFATSLKTGLILLGVVVSIAPLCLISGAFRAAMRQTVRSQGLVTFFGGFVLVPGLTLLVLLVLGGAGPFVDQVLLGHGGGGAGARFRLSSTAIIAAAIGAASLGVAALSLRGPAGPKRVGVVLVGLSAIESLVVLNILWKIRPQDLLPIYSVLAVVIAGALRQSLALRPWLRCFVSCAAAAALLAWLLATVKDERPLIRAHEDFVTATLRMTAPTEPVLDAKGELVFRRRAYFPVLDAEVRDRLQSGALADTSPEDLVRTGAGLALASLIPLLPRGGPFLRAHYLGSGDLLVAGLRLDARLPVPSAERRFDIAIPGRYAILDGDRPVAGTIDGRVFRSPVDLLVGPHVLLADVEGPTILIAWNRAAEAGFR